MSIVNGIISRVLHQARVLIACGSVAAVLAAAPPPAMAQPSDEWEVTLAPFYLWAIETNGKITAGERTVPIFLDFANATDSLSAAFSFHLEARRNRLGFLADLNFIGLETEADVTLPGRTLTAEVGLDTVMFDVGGSYLLSEERQFSVIGGLRTYTLSPKIEFTGPGGGSVAPLDTSATSVNGFVGFTFRPALTDKWTFLSRADIGGGGAELTWGGMLGFEYRFKPWGGLVFGYRALGIDAGDSEDITEYDVTQYGPIVSLALHFGKR